MQACSSNRITQGAHGTSKAVDLSAKPDPIGYAPEDGTIDSYMQRGSGTSDAGLALRMRGANGLHQFGHTSESLVPVGAKVKRGQPIFVMGHTGYTIPSGPAGAHCHWWIQTPKGYVYPPNLINEPFMKLGSGGGTPMTQAEAEAIAAAVYPGLTGREASAADIKNTAPMVLSGKFRQLFDGHLAAQEVKNHLSTKYGKTVEVVKPDPAVAAERDRLAAKVTELEKKLAEAPQPQPGNGKQLKDYTVGELIKELGA